MAVVGSVLGNYAPVVRGLGWTVVRTAAGSVSNMFLACQVVTVPGAAPTARGEDGRGAGGSASIAGHPLGH